MMDIAGMRSSGRWYTGISNGTSITTHSLKSWNNSTVWQDFRVGDFDNDGDDDIYARQSAGQWWIARPNSNGTDMTTSFGTQWNEALGWNEVLIGDFDGDNRADIAGKTDGNTWFVARSNGTRLLLKQWAQWNAASTWISIVGDFDGDGKDDIAGMKTNNGAWWVGIAQEDKRFKNTYFGRWSNFGGSAYSGGGELG